MMIIAKHTLQSNSESAPPRLPRILKLLFGSDARLRFFFLPYVAHKTRSRQKAKSNASLAKFGASLISTP